MDRRNGLKRINGYLREEFPGQLELLKKAELGIIENDVEDLESSGIPAEEIRRLILEAE